MELISKVGHYYWRDNEDRIVISDESADGVDEIGKPENTDDGILYLDEEGLRNIDLKKARSSFRQSTYYLLPIITTNGEKRWTPAETNEFYFALGLALGVKQ